jgi:hypothetical protein
MTKPSRPKLTSESEYEIEVAKNKFHREFWAELITLRVPRDGRQRSSLRPGGDHSLPRHAKVPQELRLILSRYAEALFSAEAQQYPKDRALIRWLRALKERVLDEVFIRIAQIEADGMPDDSTLTYHGLPHEQMHEGMEEGIDRYIKWRLDLYKQRTSSVPATEGKEDVGKKRREFVAPLLLKKGWSPHQWSVEMEIAYNTVANYLAGKTTPYADTLLKFAESLGIDVTLLPK